MRRLVEVLVGLALASLLGACYDDLVVVQGEVVAIDDRAKTLTVKDERAPHAEAVYQLEGPAAVKRGDVVRLAYRKTAGERRVVRLMNVSTSEAVRASKH